MSLTHLSVRNFQSIRKADLELGTFTVIVGPSSSGKSALIRAFKALASNVRGSGVITRGQKQMAITGRTDTHTVTLERSDRSGSYKIDGQDGALTFTKLAGEVPQHVTNVLRIEPVSDGSSVNFAGQFDKPYLLDESGAAVARVLGELTNVNAIFEAVRAANRVRSHASSTLKTRKNDLEHVRVRLGAFEGLSARVRALEEAEQLDTRRKEIEGRLDRLNSAVRTLQIAEKAIEKATPPEVPDSSDLNTALNHYLNVQSALRALATKQKRYIEFSKAHGELEKVAAQLQQDLHALLEEAGICPTCGQRVGQ